MNWKSAYRSFYYANAPEPEDILLPVKRTALLVVDIQNTYMEIPADDKEARRWAPFHERMKEIVIPNTARLIETCRQRGVEVIFARIACLTENGRDRSLSQKKEGFNNLLLPKDSHASAIVPELPVGEDEIVVLKTTDSALTGTNLRLLLRNLEVENVVVTGIFTDQCISSTVRSLADESFNVVVVEDCCAAGTMELHLHELEVLNMIYCHVASSEEVSGFFV
ncbi:MAG: cysteine hydrolase [Hyphomicrobiales bacterium]|nr:cysteine hydrolase [Hyphomicrobiales bacterium]